MEITVKSTQTQEASSCWAGGQPFTHQSSGVGIKALNFSFILPEFFSPTLHCTLYVISLLS